MNKLKTILTGAFIVGGFGVILTTTATQAVSLDPCELNPGSPICQDNNASVDNIIQSVINVLLFIIAVVSVIVIIIGGIMYASSAGDPSRTKKAKDAILYAVVGLVVAICAFVIVNWVVEVFIAS